MQLLLGSKDFRIDLFQQGKVSHELLGQGGYGICKVGDCGKDLNVFFFQPAARDHARTKASSPWQSGSERIRSSLSQRLRTAAGRKVVMNRFGCLHRVDAEGPASTKTTRGGWLARVCILQKRMDGRGVFDCVSLREWHCGGVLAGL
jgi:hypothetical protein